MKRFYEHVTVAERGGGFQLLLDERPIKTAMGKAQLVPSRALAEAMRREWSEQPPIIDPAKFIFRDMADFAIDLIKPEPAPHIAKVLGFLETDTLCYRAAPEDAFFQRQEDIWEPLVIAFERNENVRLERTSGIMHRPQAASTLNAVREHLQAFDPFTLAAFVNLTSLSASLIIGMTALCHDADHKALWAAANLEEDWQIEQWGADAEATAVRARRTAEFDNAMRFYHLLNE
ncbi:MAG: ATP12 family protein [Pontixanthobacter sp.]